MGVPDAAADARGLPRRPLHSDELVEIARRRTGLHDFSGVYFAEPLPRLLELCTNEANLGLSGRMVTRWDVLHFLSNLLRRHMDELTAPAMPDERSGHSILITGLPRSGTSFLRRMMMLDPANRRSERTIAPRADWPERRAPQLALGGPGRGENSEGNLLGAMQRRNAIRSPAAGSFMPGNR
jgi:hypothetical protein